MRESLMEVVERFKNSPQHLSLSEKEIKELAIEEFIAMRSAD